MKRKIILEICDQSNITELSRKIVREYAQHIYGHSIIRPSDIELEIKTDEDPISYPFVTEEYPDEEES